MMPVSEAGAFGHPAEEQVSQPGEGLGSWSLGLLFLHIAGHRRCSLFSRPRYPSPLAPPTQGHVLLRSASSAKGEESGRREHDPRPAPAASRLCPDAAGPAGKFFLVCALGFGLSFLSRIPQFLVRGKNSGLLQIYILHF